MELAILNCSLLLSFACSCFLFQCIKVDQVYQVSRFNHQIMYLNNTKICIPKQNGNYTCSIKTFSNIILLTMKTILITSHIEDTRSYMLMLQIIQIKIGEIFSGKHLTSLYNTTKINSEKK